MPCPRHALRYIVVVLLTAALVSACGFRPRGSVTLPEDFKEVYVEAPVEIADELEIFLRNGGASVIDSSGEADAVIKVGSQRYDERVVAVNATTGKGREFELLYTLNFSVRMRDGTMLVPTERIVVRRLYVFDPTAVLGATQNVAELKREMRRDAAERIIRLTQAALGS